MRGKDGSIRKPCAQTLLEFLLTRTSGQGGCFTTHSSAGETQLGAARASRRNVGARGIAQWSFGLLQLLIGWRVVRRYRLVLFQLLDLGSLTIDLTLLC